MAADEGYKKGMVKEVKSGDTLVIIGLNWDKGLPPSKTLCISGIDCPRMGFRENKDDPFAFQSREFLRKKIVGKTVAFKTEYVIPGGSREFGSVFLGSENLAEVMIGSGWAKLRPKKGDYPADETLQALSDAAETQGKGMWTQEPGAGAASVRDVTDGVDDAISVKDLADGRQLDATVEYVFDAARLRVLLGPPYHLVAFNLSGVQAPPIRRQADGTEDAAPYAKEAKFFTERNVLCHDVKVILEGTDKFNNFFGSMFYEDDSGNSVNLGLQLVMQGMAKCVDWSLKFASGAEGLRAAEVGAKEQSLRIWKDWVPPVRKPSASTAVDTKEFYATLAEVRSGDRIMVLNSDTQEEQEVVLSSVRANRMGNARRGVKNEPYSWEAREFCRKYVGKRCLVSLEYTRKISPVDGGEEFSLMQGTIMVESKRDRTFTANLAVMLVEAGLASVAQHRDDDERSAHYDELVVAESLAAQKLVNMHAKTQKQGAQQKDVTSGEGGPKQAISLLPSMKRSGRMQAVVEYVYNGGRFKLYLPKQACFVNFALSLISVPTTSRGRPGDSDEPFAKEVATYARSKVFQRNVTVTVETCDRGGTFIGVLEVNNGLNFAHDLVQRGFAYIRVERFADSGILAMEAKAKADKLAIWEHYVEDKGDTVDTPEEEFLEVSVVEICSAGHFFVQQSSDASTLAWVAEELAREELDSKDSPPSRPPRGALCCAKWCGDWYRAKVVKNEGEGLRVLFVDYGNQDVVPVETLRPMSDSLKSTPPVALECRLAGLACPELDSEYGEMAAHYFRDLTWGKTLVAKVEFRAKGSTWVSLFDQAATTTPTEMQTVSESLLVEGMARMGSVPPTVKLPELMEKHAKDEATAKRNRAGMWRYGDVGGDDEAPEFGRRKDDPVKKGGQRR